MPVILCSSRLEKANGKPGKVAADWGKLRADLRKLAIGRLEKPSIIIGTARGRLEKASS